MLRFPDNTMVAVKGLDDILAALYAEKKKANSDTARQIIEKLIEKKNFIPSDEMVHREYAFVLLEEYKKYMAKHSTEST